MDLLFEVQKCINLMLDEGVSKEEMLIILDEINLENEIQKLNDSYCKMFGENIKEVKTIYGVEAKFGCLIKSDFIIIKKEDYKKNNWGVLYDR